MSVIKAKEYNIEIGSQKLKTISTFMCKRNYSSHFIICDENTFHFCFQTLRLHCPELKDAKIIRIKSGEENKSLEFSSYIWQTLIKNKADKNSLLVNLGGGLVSDLGGFCASIYKRGIDFINIPTSLLAMVDASVGGKTGIDFAGLKNLIGTFAQPKAVFVYPDFLKTLNQRNYKNGLAEVFKIALVSDKLFWNQLKDLKADHDVKEIILKSILLKNKIVLKDPCDNGVRKTLNFGHSIGHAIESLLLNTFKELLHGEAIVIGMIIESHIAFQKKLLTKKDFQEINSTIKRQFDPAKIDLSITSVLEILKNDKKNYKNKLKFSLVHKIGSCKFDVEVNEMQIKKAFDFYNATV